MEVAVRMGKGQFVGLFMWYRLELWPNAAPWRWMTKYAGWVFGETWQLNNVTLATMPKILFA